MSRAVQRTRIRRSPRRQFKQARSQRTYQALLEAAAEVFARIGFDAAQTPEIAKRAGVSTGAFYRYFVDKRQVFLEVARIHLEEATAAVAAELRPERFLARGANVREAIDLALDVLFARILKDAPLERVMLQMSLRDPDVMALRTRYDTVGLEILTRMIELVIPKKVAPHPRAAALVIHAAALEIAAERAGLSTARARDLPDKEVREALREMIHRYLYP